MSGVTRRLLGGVLAISLFVSSSLLAFAAVDTYVTLPYFNGFSLYYKSNSNVSGTAVQILPSGDDSYFSYYSYDSVISCNEVNFTLAGNSTARSDGSTLYFKVPASGYYTVDISFTSSIDFTDYLFNFSSWTRLDRSNSSDYVYFEDSSIIFNSFRISSGDFINQYSITYFIPEAISENDNGTTSLGFNFTFKNVISFDSVSVNVAPFNVSGFPVDESSWFSQIYDLIRDGFLAVSNLIVSNENSAQSDYSVVTDPSTSQEIQDTQDMIDNVEDFEASLNQNITTEFNKIDFTTPTNLAAPVSFVADKVTRSVNALGSGYQPLVFVPLTLGIMLIFLGRGVTALGQMRPSSRFDPLDHIRDNSRDERWLW